MEKIALITLMLIALFGCGHTNNKMDLEKETPAIKEDAGILNKYWKLKILDGKPIVMAANQEREQYFILKNDSTINGFAGCNQFSGTFTLEDGNRIHFNENMAMTMKMCLDVAVNESEFIEVFTIANNYTINGDTLRLNVGRRASLAVFESVEF